MSTSGRARFKSIPPPTMIQSLILRFDGRHDASHYRAPTESVVGDLVVIQFRTGLGVVNGP